jgi:thiol:disulfide interchange protein DsbD
VESSPVLNDGVFGKSSALNFQTAPVTSNEFLDPEQAFVVSARMSSPQQIVLKWQIAEGYYLYQQRLKFNVATGTAKLGAPIFPPSKTKDDPSFGKVEIYEHSLEVKLPVENLGAASELVLNISYQGCASAGLCYPPIEKTLPLIVPQGAVNSVSPAPSVVAKPAPVENISEQDRITRLLENSSVWYSLLMFFGFGLLLSFTPCVFPMIPILSSIIVGEGKHVTTRRAFIMSLTYVLAMAFTYSIAGVFAGLLGENLQAAFQNPWIISAFALVFVALSLSMFGFYELQMPSFIQTKLTHVSNKQQGGSLFGVAIMGLLSALIVGPCVAAPLAGALIYIGQTGNAVFGGFALFALSMGMGIPLILIGTSSGHVLPRAGEWMDGVKAIFGVLLLVVAIWMLERVLPPVLSLLLWASLLIVSAIYMGAVDNLGAGVTGWRKLWKGFGIILLVYGILQLIGVASGNYDRFQPLKFQNLMSSSHAASGETQFKRIKGMEALQQELAQARDKIVMLDFYADWCVSCKEMETLTFNDPSVQQALKNVILLQTDVTANDAQDKALYKQFNLFGPPAILFFKQQQEQQAARIIGFMPAAEFRQHLSKITGSP